jgi:hypothetical protein
VSRALARFVVFVTLTAPPGMGCGWIVGLDDPRLISADGAAPGVDGRAADVAASAGIERIAAQVIDGGSGPVLGVDTPPGVLPGDVLLITLYVGSGEAASAALGDPRGWTVGSPLAAVACGGFLVWYGHRVAQAGDPMRYEFTFTGKSAIRDTAAALLVYRGVDPARPLAAQHSRPMRQGDFSLPQLTVPVANSRLVAMFVDGFNGGGHWEPPAGTTEVLDAGVFGVFDARQDSPGPSTGGSARPDAGGCGTVMAVALAPK